MYIAPSSGHTSLNFIMPFKLILRRFDVVWSENAALSERLMEIHSNPPILYYGYKNPPHTNVIRSDATDLSLSGLCSVPFDSICCANVVELGL